MGRRRGGGHSRGRHSRQSTVVSHARRASGFPGFRRSTSLGTCQETCSGTWTKLERGKPGQGSKEGGSNTISESPRSASPGRGAAWIQQSAVAAEFHASTWCSLVLRVMLEDVLEVLQVTRVTRVTLVEPAARPTCCHPGHLLRPLNSAAHLHAGGCRTSGPDGKTCLPATLTL